MLSIAIVTISERDVMVAISEDTFFLLDISSPKKDHLLK
jgi:hypothetical protein